MDWQKLIVDLANSDAAIAVIVALATTLGAWVFTKKPKWQTYFEKYSGAFVRGIKLAEANIPDDTTNKNVKRLDDALQYVIRVIEAGEKKKLSEEDKIHLEAKVSEVHADIESTLVKQ